MALSNTAPPIPDFTGQRLQDLSANRLRRALQAARQLGPAGVLALLRDHGARRSLAFVVRNIRHMIAHRLALRWDRRHGVDTAGSIRLDTLSVRSPNRKYGNECICTSPRSFEFMMRSLPHDPRGYTFIDIGAGKGRAILLASRYGFDKVIGVEFASELVACARSNIASFMHAKQLDAKQPDEPQSSHDRQCRDPEQRCNLEIVEADATEFVLPAGPLLIYFYNPFTRDIFDAVLRNITASLADDTRDCTVIYGSSSADAIGWAVPAILATGLFAQVPAPPMPLFFDAVRTIRFAVFRSKQ